ncbi:MAG: hypothetical protein ACRD6W_17450, partial [Nitrososphaerales archaeon]
MRGTLRLYVYPKIGSMSMDSVKRTAIQELVNGWSGAARTIARQYAVLRALFNFAELNDWLRKSPCRGIKLPEQAALVRHELTPEEVVAISGALEERDSLAALVGAATGFHWGEAFALRVGDVDVAAGTVT